PELVGWRRPPEGAYGRFLATSALDVLKAATAEQVVARLRHHRGSWQDGLTPTKARRIIERFLASGAARPVRIRDLEGEPVYWFPAAEEQVWADIDRPDDQVRLLGPLDTLLASRRRLKEVFGLDFLFEAYKPIADRRFYFALPLVAMGRILGLMDVRLAGGAWRIDALELVAKVDKDMLRRGVHRVAALAGAERVVVRAAVDPRLERALAGPVDPP